MAVSTYAHDVSDICLGKPPLVSVAVTATISDALSLIKDSGENYISIWNCNHSGDDEGNDCLCVGKICMVDIICFLCRDENISSPVAALNSPVSTLLPKSSNLVVHTETHSSVSAAIDLILEGAQNLVVPIERRLEDESYSFTSTTIKWRRTTRHLGREFCWITQEDVIRFLLGWIHIFSPLPFMSIDQLGAICFNNILTVDYHSPARSAVGAILKSLVDQTSVAVIDSDRTLIGEISPSALACCDETAAGAVMALSAGDLMAYIDHVGPPEDIKGEVFGLLKDSKLHRALRGLDEERSRQPWSSPLGKELSCKRAQRSSRKRGSSPSYSAGMNRRLEAIVCRPQSSLIAVMIQAIAHRINYVWVADKQFELLGMVKLSDILRILRESLQGSAGL